MKYVISVDLGATNLRVAIISSSLEIINVLREPTTPKDKSLLTKQIVRLINEVNCKKYPIESIGISACGLINNNIITKMANLQIDNYDLVTGLKQEFNLPVYILNDANATALSEANFGSGKEYDNVYFITISSGIGGALVLNKKLIDLPFEIGHHKFTYCSSIYEIEELLSGNGIPKLCALNNLKVEKASDFFALVESNNQLAKKILDIYIELLSIVFYNLQLDYNTDCIILSGGVMKSSSLFVEKLKEKTNNLLDQYPVKKINFVFAKFDQDAGLFGGASTALIK